jgi:hypothetical protein
VDGGRMAAAPAGGETWFPFVPTGLMAQTAGGTSDGGAGASIGGSDARMQLDEALHAAGKMDPVTTGLRVSPKRGMSDSLSAFIVEVGRSPCQHLL